MFIRQRVRNRRIIFWLVENWREDGRHRQRFVATLGTIAERAVQQKWHRPKLRNLAEDRVAAVNLSGRRITKILAQLGAKLEAVRVKPSAVPLPSSTRLWPPGSAWRRWRDQKQA